MAEIERNLTTEIEKLQGEAEEQRKERIVEKETFDSVS